MANGFLLKWYLILDYVTSLALRYSAQIQLREFISNMWTQNVACHFSKVLLSNCCCHQAISHCSHPSWCPLRGAQDGKHQNMILDNGFDAYQRGISPVQTLASSHTEKSTKIINFRCLGFCMISSHLLIFHPIWFTFPAKTHYPSSLLSESSSSALSWEVASPGCSPQ